MSTQKRFVLGVLIPLAVLVGVLVYLWQAGWFTPSPAAVLKDTFQKANEGRYAEATENLFAVTREEFARDPKLMNFVWETVTMGKTVEELTILDEQVLEDSAIVSFEITYTAGASIQSTADFSLEGGAWKHSLVDLHKKVLAANAPQPAPLPTPKPEDLKLEQDHKRFVFTNVSLRLPEGSQWSPKSSSAEHPTLGLSILANAMPGISVDEAIARAKDVWQLPDHTLTSKQEVEISQVKGMFFDGKVKSPWGESRPVLVLVLGNDKDSATLSILAAPREAVVKLARDCLFSAKWENGLYGDSLAMLPYTIEPAKGLKLFRSLVVDECVFFTESGKSVASKPAEAFFNIIAVQLPDGKKERKAAFQEMIKNLPPYFGPPKFDPIQPLKVHALEGFEVSATVHVPASKMDLFRYTAALFKSDAQVYLFEGMTPLPKRELFEPEFKKMVRSFRLK
jgi:hypothetical protein